jgi:transglutaminase-like putative cysteine protease
VQSDDKVVQDVASQVAPEETDPWRLARALERAVHDMIDAKDFSQAFATAAEVAQTRQGDCTEHAVLLAALCRARRLPARLAIGLVYSSPDQAFAYHMWNEVWIHDRWVPLDATIGQGGIGAAHVKLADSNLDGAGAYSTFLPVLKVMGRLELEIVEVE